MVLLCLCLFSFCCKVEDSTKQLSEEISHILCGTCLLNVLRVWKLSFFLLVFETTEYVGSRSLNQVAGLGCIHIIFLGIKPTCYGTNNGTSSPLKNKVEGEFRRHCVHGVTYQYKRRVLSWESNKAYYFSSVEYSFSEASFIKLKT